MKSFNKMIALLLLVASSAGAVVSFDYTAFAAAKTTDADRTAIMNKLYEDALKEERPYTAMAEATKIGDKDKFSEFYNGDTNTFDGKKAAEYVLNNSTYFAVAKRVVGNVLGSKAVQYGVIGTAGVAGAAVEGYNIYKGGLKNTYSAKLYGKTAELVKKGRSKVWSMLPERLTHAQANAKKLADARKPWNRAKNFCVKHKKGLMEFGVAGTVGTGATLAVKYFAPAQYQAALNYAAPLAKSVVSSVVVSNVLTQGSNLFGKAKGLFGKTAEVKTEGNDLPDTFTPSDEVAPVNVCENVDAYLNAKHSGDYNPTAYPEYVA